MNLLQRYLRIIQPPKKKAKPAPEAKPEPKGGRFKVTIKPVLRGGTSSEWWAKVDDSGVQVHYGAYYSKIQAEVKARGVIRGIKEREKHKNEPIAQWEED